MSDAVVMDAILEASFNPGRQGRRKPTPAGLCGRRKMTTYLRRNGLPEAAACTVERCLRVLGRAGVRRGKAVRTTIPGRDGHRAGTC